MKTSTKISLLLTVATCSFVTLKSFSSLNNNNLNNFNKDEDKIFEIEEISTTVTFDNKTGKFTSKDIQNLKEIGQEYLTKQLKSDFEKVKKEKEETLSKIDNTEIKEVLQCDFDNKIEKIKKEVKEISNVYNIVQNVFNLILVKKPENNFWVISDGNNWDVNGFTLNWINNGVNEFGGNRVLRPEYLQDQLNKIGIFPLNGNISGWHAFYLSQKTFFNDLHKDEIKTMKNFLSSKDIESSKKISIKLKEEKQNILDHLDFYSKMQKTIVNIFKKYLPKDVKTSTQEEMEENYKRSTYSAKLRQFI